jgi:predicted small secreted protein
MLALKNLIFMALLICFTALSSGCNTISGLGEDLQAAGEAIQDKAEDVQDGDAD